MEGFIAEPDLKLVHQSEHIPDIGSMSSNESTAPSDLTWHAEQQITNILHMSSSEASSTNNIHTHQYSKSNEVGYNINRASLNSSDIKGIPQYTPNSSAEAQTLVNTHIPSYVGDSSHVFHEHSVPDIAYLQNGLEPFPLPVSSSRSSLSESRASTAFYYNSEQGMNVDYNKLRSFSQVQHSQAENAPLPSSQIPYTSDNFINQNAMAVGSSRLLVPPYSNNTIEQPFQKYPPYAITNSSSLNTRYQPENISGHIPSTNNRHIQKTPSVSSSQTRKNTGRNVNVKSEKKRVHKYEMTPETASRNRCKICNKQFLRPSSLQTHYYSHTGVKLFKCPWDGCGKLFSVKSNMSRHCKIHERDLLRHATDNSDSDTSKD